jgi:hypothetical protein
MANKVTLLRSGDDGLGGTNRTLMFWYVISPLITDTLANTVVPMPSSRLASSGNPDAGKYVSTADSNALDAGSAGFEIVNRLQSAGESNAAFTARIRAEQVARETAWVASTRTAYALSGTAIN